MLFHYQRNEVDLMVLENRFYNFAGKNVFVGMNPNCDLKLDSLTFIKKYFTARNRTLFFESRNFFDATKYIIDNFEQGFIFLLAKDLMFEETIWCNLFFGKRQKIFFMPYRELGIFLTLEKFRLNGDTTIDLPDSYQNFSKIYMTLQNDSSLAEIQLLAI